MIILTKDKNTKIPILAEKAQKRGLKNDNQFTSRHSQLKCGLGYKEYNPG